MTVTPARDGEEGLDLVGGAASSTLLCPTS